MNQHPVGRASCVWPAWALPRRVLGSALITVAAPPVFGASAGIITTPALAHTFFGGLACDASNFAYPSPAFIAATVGLVGGFILCSANIAVGLSDANRSKKPEPERPVGHDDLVVIDENFALITTPPPSNLLKDICKKPFATNASGAIWGGALYEAGLCFLLDGSTCDLSKINLGTGVWIGLVVVGIAALLIHGFGVLWRHWGEKNLIADDEISLAQSDFETISESKSSEEESDALRQAEPQERPLKVAGKEELRKIEEDIPKVVVNPPQTLTPKKQPNPKIWLKNDNAMQFRKSEGDRFNPNQEPDTVNFSVIHESDNISDAECCWIDATAGIPVDAFTPIDAGFKASVDASSKISVDADTDADANVALSEEGDNK